MIRPIKIAQIVVGLCALTFASAERTLRQEVERRTEEVCSVIDSFFVHRKCIKEKKTE